MLDRNAASPRPLQRPARRIGALLLAALTAGCGSLNPFAASAPSGGGTIAGFQGAVVAPEPRAAEIGREVLAHGGTAADAATAMGFALAVTLPSRVGLGGAGACLSFIPGAKAPEGGVPQAILFTAEPASAAGDRPAAVPMLARGLYLLHARSGHLPLAGLIAPAEELARFGTLVSAPLARDLGVVAGPLLADPSARAVFGPSGQPLAEGARLVQPALAASLSRLRIAGIGDFYQGELARRLVRASADAGGPIPPEALRRALPRLAAPIVLRDGSDRIAFLPPPADGGLAAAAAFQTLRRDPKALAEAGARALSVASAWRRGGTSAAALLAGQAPPGGLPPLPASATFLAMDRAGGAVACATSMGNLFGTGRILPGLGFLLAASPATTPPPLLAAALAWNPNLHAFRAEVAGSGQDGAPLAVAAAMQNTLASGRPMPVPVPDPGRAQAIACARYLPSESGSCGWAADPRGGGLASGGN
ncbi:MAG: gamma-glutamyltransferase [Rhodospirillales bacterium]|nr:gamma-glutamyltransferase [Rhodospirillales bacterium]